MRHLPLTFHAAEGQPLLKRAELEGHAAPRRPAVPQPDLSAPPNKTLFVQNLPDDITEATLVPLFQALPGFVEVRLVPGKKGIAFVEFQNEIQSGAAMVELQGYPIDPTHKLVISFQKRL